MTTEEMNNKDKKIKSLEYTIQGLKRSRLSIAICAYALGILGICAVSDAIIKEDKNSRYNQMFLQETDKLPTKQDSIYFYQKNGLGEYIVDGNPVEIPYKEIKRIVKGELN